MNRHALRHLECVRATIRYKSPVRAEALPNGHRTLFQAGWVIEGGPYDGEWAMIPCSFDPWVPSSELIKMKRVFVEEYLGAKRRLL